MRDLQRRLASFGFEAGGDEPGCYGPATEAAIRAFQAQRGLRTDGTCGTQTWSALVEAGYRLGDRLLYRQARMLRGDDVATLQRRLGALGFDAGRVDGIFGELTAGALQEFQRNVGLTVDGICGPATLQALARLGGRTESQNSVVAVREREALRSAPRTLQGRVITVGDVGGIDALARGVSRSLLLRGGDSVILDHPDGSAQAAEANKLGAALYVGLSLTTDASIVAFYSVPGFVSYGGRALAGRMAEVLGSGSPLASCEPVGMSLPILRETKMPAVVCELGPAHVVVAHSGAVGRAIADAVVAWMTEPEE